jgi:ribosomal protein S18 acetylase RimI-like enzyme
MVIRNLTKRNVTAMREIDALSFSAGDQYGEAYYDEIVGSPDFEPMGVADDGDGIRAWALVDVKASPIRIRSLAVHPKFRRRGFATALINAVVSGHHGAIDLLVDPGNHGAIALYEKLGFHLRSLILSDY